MTEAMDRVLDYVKSPYASTSYLVSDMESCFEILDKAERNKAFAEGRRTIKNFLLPALVSVVRGESMPCVSNSGRGRLHRVAQLKGCFTKDENSPYKKHKPFKVNTSLWPIEGHPRFLYGTIGITGPSGEITEDNKDLLILETSDWKRMRFHVYPGLAVPDKFLDYALVCVSTIEEKSQ